MARTQRWLCRGWVLGLMLLAGPAFAGNATYFGSFIVAPDTAGAIDNKIYTYNQQTQTNVVGDTSLESAVSAHLGAVQVMSISYGLSPTHYEVNEGFAFNSFMVVDGSTQALPGSHQGMQSRRDVEADLYLSPNFRTELNEFQAAKHAVEENSASLPDLANALLASERLALKGGATGVPFDAVNPSRLQGFDRHPPATISTIYFTIDRETVLDGDPAQPIYPSDVLKCKGGTISVFRSHVAMHLDPDDEIWSLAVDTFYYLFNGLDDGTVLFTLGPDSPTLAAGWGASTSSPTSSADHVLSLIQTGFNAVVFRWASASGSRPIGIVTSVDTIDPEPVASFTVVAEGTTEEPRARVSGDRAQLDRLLAIEVNGVPVAVPPTYSSTNGDYKLVDLDGDSKMFHVELLSLTTSGEAWSQSVVIEAESLIPPIAADPDRWVVATWNAPNLDVDVYYVGFPVPAGDLYLMVDEVDEYSQMADPFAVNTFSIGGLLPGHHSLKLRFEGASAPNREVVISADVPSSVPTPEGLVIERALGAKDRYQISWNVPAGHEPDLVISRDGTVIAESADFQYTTPLLAEGRYNVEVRNRQGSGGTGPLSVPLEASFWVKPALQTLDYIEPETFSTSVGDLAFVPAQEAVVVLHPGSSAFDWLVLYGEPLTLQGPQTRQVPSQFNNGVPVAVTHVTAEGPQGLTENLDWIVGDASGLGYDLVRTDVPEVRPLGSGPAVLSPVAQSVTSINFPSGTTGTVSAMAFDSVRNAYLIARGGELFEVPFQAGAPSLTATPMGIAAAAVTAVRDGCFTVPGSEDLVNYTHLVDYRSDAVTPSPEPYGAAQIAGLPDIAGLVDVPMGRAGEKYMFAAYRSTLYKLRGRQMIEEVGVADNPFRSTSGEWIVLGDWDGDGLGFQFADLMFAVNIPNPPVTWPGCERAADIDSNGVIDINDVVLTLDGLQLGLSPFCGIGIGPMSCGEPCP